MFAVGMSRAAFCAAAEMLLLLATLLVATVYCLPYVCMRHGLLLLAMHIPEQLVATFFLLWLFLTKKIKRVKKCDLFAR